MCFLTQVTHIMSIGSHTFLENLLNSTFSSPTDSHHWALVFDPVTNNYLTKFNVCLKCSPPMFCFKSMQVCNVIKVKLPFVECFCVPVTILNNLYLFSYLILDWYCYFLYFVSEESIWVIHPESLGWWVPGRMVPGLLSSPHWPLVAT